MKHHGAEPGLTERLAALREAVEIADGRLLVPQVQAARTVLAKAGAREALGSATVVALAGATGSGKSTLFNTLSGSQVSEPGVRRPTTGVAHATTWGRDQSRLLDWLEVPRRHQHPDPDPTLDGLVLLDLPDHDSTRLENRLEVDRLVELVDVLVWVLDPQKYADAAVHDRYLSPRAGHAGVLVVVLNQIDRLDAAAARECAADLRGLLDREGLQQSPLLAVSARSGEGLEALRDLLRRRVAARRAATDRLTADVRAAATALAEHCGGQGAGLSQAATRQLSGALADAAGVPVVVEAVTRSSARAGTASTGWPLVRWVGRLRADPLRRLHLSPSGAGSGGRTSLPEPSTAQRAALSTALRRARDDAGDGLPQAWRDDLRRTVEVREDVLADHLDRAVAGADLGPNSAPGWARAVGGLQWLLLLTALVGALWLLGLAGLGYLQLDDVLPTPRVGRLPLPTLLLGAGLLAGALLALVAAPLVRLGARRRGAQARRRLLAVIDAVAREELVGPLTAAGAEHARFCVALERARR